LIPLVLRKDVAPELWLYALLFNAAINQGQQR